MTKSGMVRDHSPILIDKFNGYWNRGDVDNTPIDHFSDCNNVIFPGLAAVATRPGIGISQDVEVPLQNIKRIYNFPQPTGNTLIILTYDYDMGQGNIYHYINSATIFGPLLTITGMTDFAFLPYAGRGYISPFTTYTYGGINIETGLESEFLYVYAGDGTAARKAAGSPLSGTPTIATGAAGHTDAGFKLFGWVAETASGYLTAPSAIVGFTTVTGFSTSFGNVPVSSDPSVIARRLVATINIPTYNGDTEGYQFFFVPGAVINDNTTIFLNDVSFYDADLLEDASYLLDNRTEIPAGASIMLYHGRVVLTTSFTDISLAYVSASGDPESFSTVDGFCLIPPDGNPITNAQEMRDVLYMTKRSRTVAFVDNGDVPSSWSMTVIDLALGSSVHGIATVLDSGSTSTDFLLIATYQGVSMFNGTFIAPELSWKIDAFWQSLNRSLFGKLQMLHSPIDKLIYIILPDGTMLIGNYANGMTSKAIQWSKWSFLMSVNTIAIFNINEVVIGADLVV